MTPKLKISNDGVRFCNDPNPCCLKEAEDYVKSFVKLQEKILAEMVNLKQQLPREITELDQPGKQDKYHRYIFLYSLFTFVKKVSEILEDPYHKLTDAIRKKGNTIELKEKLDKLCQTLANIPFDNLVKEHCGGMQKLEKFKSSIPISGCWKVINPGWMFGDIVGIIHTNDLQHESLLKDFLAEDCPTAPSVIDLKQQS